MVSFSWAVSVDFPEFVLVLGIALAIWMFSTLIDDDEDRHIDFPSVVNNDDDDNDDDNDGRDGGRLVLLFRGESSEDESAYTTDSESGTTLIWGPTEVSDTPSAPTPPPPPSPWVRAILNPASSLFSDDSDSD